MSASEDPNQMSDKENLSRRELLKAITAVGGALGAAAFLPEKWSKPVIEGGVIPAHAQSSQDLPSVTVFRAEPTVAEFNFSDPSCGISDSTLLDAWISGCETMIHSGTAFSSLSRTGSGCSGIVKFFFETSCNITEGSQLCVRISVNGRESNTSCALINFGQPEPV